MSVRRNRQFRLCVLYCYSVLYILHNNIIISLHPRSVSQGMPRTTIMRGKTSMLTDLRAESLRYTVSRFSLQCLSSEVAHAEFGPDES